MKDNLDEKLRLGPYPELSIAALRELGLTPASISGYLRVDRALVSRLAAKGDRTKRPHTALRPADPH